MSDIGKQIRLRPVIRVFVSSTFNDMKHERNALQEHVFPKLEELCLKNGFQFQAIDLRWGVSTEAGLDHRAMRICFDELRRAQEISPEPNFLILLGNRYGWRPLPEAISHTEFEKLATAARTGGEEQEPLPGAHGKTALQVLEEWYRCDENVVLPDPPKTDPDRAPLNYILQPRTQNLSDKHDYKRRKDDPTKDTQDWMDVQEVLWRLINDAFPATPRCWFDAMNWPQHVADVNDRQHPKRAIPQIVRFQASATEQEIWCGALSAMNAERHVIACFREIANRDDYPAGEVKDFFDLTDSGQFDEAADVRQTALKEAIRLRLGENNKPLPIPFTSLKRDNGKVLLDAPKAETLAFCDAVYENFRPIIERQIEEYWNKSTKDSPARATRELKIEQDEHKRFGRERGGKESFVGRDYELKAIQNYLSGDSRWPLVVHGSSGCGKTALMWRALEDVPATRKPIIRLIGTTPHSSDLRSLLSSLCQELRQRNPRSDPLPTEIKELRDELSQHLQAATPEQPLILFLDALDQLADADNGRSLNWLPLTQEEFGAPPSDGPEPAQAGTPNTQEATSRTRAQLPAHMKLVVSCVSGRAAGDPAGQPYAELKRRGIPAEIFKGLDELSEAEARLLLFDRWLPKAGRKVNADQRAQIEQRLSSPACRQPIFLKLLFEEVQLWHSYDPAPVPGESVPALLGQLFDRLCQPTNHGLLLVNRVLGYLSASRHGLAENEILEILFADPEYRAKLDEATEQTRHELPPNAKRIPIALWSRLRFDLAPYLTERAAPGANVLTFYHRQVAEWVQERFAKSSDQSWQPHRRLADYFRKLADPENNQSWKGDSPRPLVELPFHVLQSPNWQELAAILKDIFFLEAKIAHGLAFDLVGDFADAVRQLPRDHPQHRILSLLEEALRRDVHFIASHVSDYPQALFQCLWNSCWWYDSPEAARYYEWLLDISSIRRPPWAEEGPKISALLESWLSYRTSRRGSFKWLRSLRPPSVSLGGTLSASFSGDCATSQCTSAPTERDTVSEPVESILVSSNGKVITAISASTIRSWNRSTGEPLRQYSFQPWSLSQLEELMTVILQTSQPISFEHGRSVLLRDHRIAVGERDGDILILDSVSEQQLHRLQGNEEGVALLEYSPNGSLLASVSLDGAVRIWDPTKEATWIEPPQMTPEEIMEGIRDFGAGSFSAMRRTRGGELRTLLTCHPGEITRIKWSPTNNRIAAGTLNGVLHVLHLQETLKNTRFETGGPPITAIAFSADGSRLATGNSRGSISIWGLPDGHLVSSLADHGAEVTALVFCDSDSGLLSAARDGTVQMWGSVDQARVARLRGFEGKAPWDILAIAPNAAVLALANHSASEVTVFSIPDGKRVTSFVSPADRGSGNIEELGFSHDSAQVTAIGDNDYLRNECVCVSTHDAMTGLCLDTRSLSRQAWEHGRGFQSQGERDAPLVVLMPLQLFPRSRALNQPVVAGIHSGIVFLLRLEVAEVRAECQWR